MLVQGSNPLRHGRRRPAIHGFAGDGKKVMDGRDKPGHDEENGLK
jgi:hypothetical protein